MVILQSKSWYEMFVSKLSDVKLCTCAYYSYKFLFNDQSFKFFFKNVNIVKTQIFYKMKFDLKGHPRSYKTIHEFCMKCSKNFAFFLHLYCLLHILIKITL